LAELKFKGKILVSDLDGTLLDKRKRISTENAAAIKRFREGGGLFTLATGRMFRAVEHYLEYITLDLPALVFNGAAIYDFYSGEILWRQYLPEEIYKIARKVLDEFPGIGLEVLKDDKLFVVRKNDEVDEHIHREGVYPSFASSPEELRGSWFKILLAWKPSRLKQVEYFLGKLREEGTIKFRYVYSEPQFLEILDESVTKGSALKRLLSMFGYHREQVIAVGDNQNDLEMIKTAGTGIAVGNAHEDLKKAAGFVCTSDNENSAIAEIVELIEKGVLSPGKGS